MTRRYQLEVLSGQTAERLGELAGDPGQDGPAIGNSRGAANARNGPGTATDAGGRTVPFADAQTSLRPLPR